MYYLMVTDAAGDRPFVYARDRELLDEVVKSLRARNPRVRVRVVVQEAQAEKPSPKPPRQR